MPKSSIVLLAAALATAMSTSTLAQSRGDAETIRATIADPAHDVGPGCAVGVFKDGKTLFVASGLADIAERRVANADTRFYSGSLAKQFTALAVTQLVIAGKIGLDDDIRKYLPEVPASAAPITVAQLLSHTAGIANSAKLLPLAGYARVSDATRDDTMQMLLRYPHRAFPPGATFEYSNGGYLMLSEIVERVSGVPFALYVQQSILTPLGMNRSLVLQGELPRDVNMARGYAPQGDDFVLSEDFPKFGGAGAMMLTINDLAKYYNDIEKGHKIWTPEVAKIMLRQARYADGSPVILPVPGYYFGYSAGLMFSHDWVLHGGNYAGFQALFAWLPGHDRGIGMLCNRADVQPTKLATRIFAAIDSQLPGVDAPRYALPAPDGDYLSDDLPVTYRLASIDGGLRVTVSTLAGERRSVLDFARTADGAYGRTGQTLVFDPDRRGFWVTSGPIGARFHRAPATVQATP